MKFYFIIGTDTDCGKTYVTCQLIKYFKSKHQKVLGIKPVMSGLGADVELLQKYNYKDIDICKWSLTEPISPHLAAIKDGVNLTAEEISAFCMSERFNHLDYLLIEGAGGLLVPLNEEETWVDVLQLTKIPVILVVGMRIGCLNHALLTALALEKHSIQCVGWIANCLQQNMLSLEDNILTLQKKLRMPLLATVAYYSNLDLNFPKISLC